MWAPVSAASAQQQKDQVRSEPITGTHVYFDVHTLRYSQHIIFQFPLPTFWLSTMYMSNVGQFCDRLGCGCSFVAGCLNSAVKLRNLLS